MRDYNKLGDVQDFSGLDNPHLINVSKPFTADLSFSNSPASLKSATNKPKLATIHELPSTNLFKSKSTTDIGNKEAGGFGDNLGTVKSKEDADSTNLGEIGFQLRKNSSNFNFDQASHLNEPNFFDDDYKQDFALVKPSNLLKSQLSKPAKELAVDVRNISFHYGKGRRSTKVLNDITLKVPLGGIYGLLGPSGCGKTSLLKIVCGLTHPDTGMVRVFGKQPGINNTFIPGPGVGYMPQDISLFSDLTVAETLVFFSKVYRMKSHLVPERIEFLLKLLVLEDKGNRLVKQLSGGQRRRVSLAAALVHSPPLVILDEPTVGVDPLLRQSIWEHLVRLANETSLTVIITTHYIEEARQAKTVGLMRFGRILVESNPEKLLERFNLNNLEDVFLNLCMRDEKEFNIEGENRESDWEDGKQIKFENDTVAYSVTPSGSKKSKEESLNNEKKSDAGKDLPEVVVSDFSLPISPHMAREKENENFDQGIRFTDRSIHKTPAPNKQTPRTPLSPLEVDKNQQADFLQVTKRDRSDTCSSVGSSIIEYDSSIHSKDSSATPVKLARFKKEFKNTFEPKSTIRNQIKTSTNKIGALFYKNITLLIRNVPLLLFEFFLPSFEIILFGICIGADPFNIPIAVFNQDTSGLLPQRFLNTIDNYTVTQIQYPTLQAALTAARNGETWGAIAFKQNFSIAIAERHIMGLQSENDTLDHSNIYVFLDMTNQLIGYKLQRTFYESFLKFSKELLVEQDNNPAAIDLPIKIGKPIYGDRDPTFTEFMAPGVVLTIAFLATVALTALAFVMERKDGIMERILVSGVTPFEFLMSHVVTQLCVIVVQVALLLIFTFLVFDIPSRGPFIWVILLTMLQAICGMTYGLLISSLCKSETAATMMALGSFYPNLLLSGTVWPTESMPYYMRQFSYFLPQTLPIEAMRYILSRGWDPSHYEVAMGFVVTILYILFFLVMIIFSVKRIQ